MLTIQEVRNAKAGGDKPRKFYDRGELKPGAAG